MTILVRHGEGRKHELIRAIQSIQSQTLAPDRIIVGVEQGWDSSYLSELGVDIITYPKNTEPYGYNDYVNLLMKEVSDDWFMVVDDDDFIGRRTALATLSRYLKDLSTMYIVSFQRGVRIKPRFGSNEIKSGRIGMPCFVLHSASMPLWDGVKVKCEDNGDYLFIKDLSGRMRTEFVPVVIVHSEKRRYGV